MASFEIVLQTRDSLYTDGEPDRFISTYAGLVLCTRDRDGKVFKVGKLKAYRIHADLAGEAGERLFDVCDAHSQPMHELYAALVDAATDDLKDSVSTQFDVCDLDILVIDYILLSPRWRGLKLGLLVARKMIDLLADGCGLVVSWIYPLNPDAAEFKKVPSGWIPRLADEAEEEAARQKLRRYFRRMGIERIKGTRFDGLSLAKKTPTLADLIKPVR